MSSWRQCNIYVNLSQHIHVHFAWAPPFILFSPPFILENNPSPNMCPVFSLHIDKCVGGLLERKNTQSDHLMCHTISTIFHLWHIFP